MTANSLLVKQIEIEEDKRMISLSLEPKRNTSANINILKTLFIIYPFSPRGEWGY